jgi:hypothetical protein
MSRPLFLPVSIYLNRLDLDANWAGRLPRDGDLEDGDLLPWAPSSSESWGREATLPMPDLIPDRPRLPKPERQRPLLPIWARAWSLLRPGAILSRRLFGT